MGKIIAWIFENKSWIFSGAGVVIISFLVHFAGKIQYVSIKHRLKYLLCHQNPEHSQDSSTYVSEYLPDGSRCFVGESFEKRWTIRNNGQIIWKNRYMKCDPLPDFLHVSREIVKIPMIYPNQEYTLKVKYRVGCEGTYKSYWKMYGKDNKLSFPHLVGLGITIYAVNKNKL